MSTTIDVRDVTVVRDHLDKARRHLATGEGLLAKQRALVEQMRRDGHDVAQAQALLAELEQTQRLNMAEVTRLSNELAGYAAAQTVSVSR